jgi:hypothetical protein
MSISLLASVRLRGSSSRASCIVNVEPPDTRRAWITSVTAARAIAIGSTPSCRQNRLSSSVTSAATKLGSTSSSATGSRHLSSRDKNTYAGRPSRYSTATDQSLRRAGSGTARAITAITSSAALIAVIATSAQRTSRARSQPTGDGVSPVSFTMTQPK